MQTTRTQKIKSIYISMYQNEEIKIYNNRVKTNLIKKTKNLKILLQILKFRIT